MKACLALTKGWDDSHKLEATSDESLLFDLLSRFPLFSQENILDEKIDKLYPFVRVRLTFGGLKSNGKGKKKVNKWKRDGYREMSRDSHAGRIIESNFRRCLIS